jgi:hypothetical protein
MVSHSSGMVDPGGVSGSPARDCSSAVARDRLALMCLTTVLAWLNRWLWVYAVSVVWWVHTFAKADAVHGKGYCSSAGRLMYYVALAGVMCGGMTMVITFCLGYRS